MTVNLLREFPSSGPSRQVAFVARHLPEIGRAARVLTSRTVLKVSPGSGPEAELMQRYLGRRAAGVVPVGRLGVSVLRIPSDVERYYTGRSRQALRTNTRRAQKDGVTVCLVPASQRGPVQRLHDDSGAIRPDQEATLRELHTCSLWMQAEHEGRVVAQTMVAVSGRWGLLLWAMTELDPAPTVSAAKYLLHGALVRECAARGVEYLADTVQPWRLPVGLFYYQRLLGFEIHSVRMRRSRPQ